jgi:hypothetical protein
VVVRRAMVVGGILGYRRPCVFASWNGGEVGGADRTGRRSFRRWWDHYRPNGRCDVFRTSGLVQNNRERRIRGPEQ